MFHETSWLYGWVFPSLQSCDRNWVHWLKCETDLNPQPGAEWVGMLCLPTHHMLKVTEETGDCCCYSEHSPVIFLSLGDFLIIYNLIIQSTLSSIQVNLKFGEVLDAFEDTSFFGLWVGDLWFLWVHHSSWKQLELSFKNQLHLDSCWDVAIVLWILHKGRNLVYEMWYPDKLMVRILKVISSWAWMNSLSLSSIASRPPSPHAMEILELRWKGYLGEIPYVARIPGCELLIYQKQ